MGSLVIVPHDCVRLRVTSRPSGSSSKSPRAVLFVVSVLFYVDGYTNLLLTRNPKRIRQNILNNRILTTVASVALSDRTRGTD